MNPTIQRKGSWTPIKQSSNIAPSGAIATPFLIPIWHWAIDRRESGYLGLKLKYEENWAAPNVDTHKTKSNKTRQNNITQNYFLRVIPANWCSIWRIFWHYIWHSIWHIFWHSIWHSIWRIFWHSIWPSLWHSIWHLALAVEVQQCPLISGARVWGSAVPTEIWSSQLRSEAAKGEGEGGGGGKQLW